MKIGKYITDDEIKDIAALAAKEAVNEYQKQEERKRKKDTYHNTFLLMKAYRDVAVSIEKSISEAEQLEIEGLSEEQKKIHVQSIRESRIRNMIMSMQIDTMLEKAREEYVKCGKEYEYRAFELYFFNGMSYEYIAEELDSGSSTARRWVTGVVRKMATLLWGYDAIMKW